LQLEPSKQDERYSFSIDEVEVPMDFDAAEDAERHEHRRN